MAMSDTLWLIAVNVLVVVAISVGIGAWAPHWPARWLTTDRFPLTVFWFEKAHHYRKFRVAKLRARLPEMGQVFGGKSKGALLGSDLESLDRYLQEVRRAEWVHILSCLSALPLFLINPWWLALAFLIAVVLVNSVFLIVLRHNRLRLLQVRQKQERRLRDR
jgi:hypothetical protein